MEESCLGCVSEWEQDPDPAELAFAALAARCFELEAMREVGCRFAISDLTPEEWQGLKLLATERNRIWKEKNEK